MKCNFCSEVVNNQKMNAGLVLGHGDQNKDGGGCVTCDHCWGEFLRMAFGLRDVLEKLFTEFDKNQPKTNK